MQQLRAIKKIHLEYKYLQFLLEIPLFPKLPKSDSKETFLSLYTTFGIKIGLTDSESCF